jgi:hypothetical protein
MAKSRPKKRKIIPNPELERALIGYVPEFGNREDIVLRGRLEKLQSSLHGVDNEVLRGIKKAGRGNPFSAKMKEIVKLEQDLVVEINKRKMDF